MTKLEKLREIIKSMSDGILISSETNRLYFTDFEYSDGYVIVTKNKAYLITDFRYAEAAKNEADKNFEIVIFKGLKDGNIQKILEENDVKTLLFEDNSVTYSELKMFENTFCGVSFVPAGNILENLREYKSDIEAEYVIKAQRIAEKSLDMLLSDLDLNMTEKEVAAYLEYLMKKNGADGISFNTIAVSGKASSLPHGVPRNVKLEKGFLTLDFGAVYKGYHSDMTRTVSIGKATEEMKKVYNTVLEAQELAINAIMNGEKSCFNIDKISRDFIYNMGYEGCFGHGLGHGVGLLIHESPRLSPAAPKEKMLEKGHIVTVEPGIYLENKFGVRIEDMIYMSEEGPKNITMTPKRLIEI
ncbi:MAG: M24 family metallopeptidase [Ruminococcaceae bacterium]|nr:M24 family metallopeptidase [Oscillospiraceae bacterium]